MLKINRTNTLDNKEYINYIIETCQKIAKNTINEKQCELWKDYIKLLYNLDIDIKDIILSGFDNLICKTYSYMYVIDIDNTILYDDKYNLESFCSLIAEGTADKQGYNIFDEVYTKVGNYIEDGTLMLLFQSERKTKNVI